MVKPIGVLFVLSVFLIFENANGEGVCDAVFEVKIHSRIICDFKCSNDLHFIERRESAFGQCYPR